MKTKRISLPGRQGLRQKPLSWRWQKEPMYFLSGGMVIVAAISQRVADNGLFG